MRVAAVALAVLALAACDREPDVRRLDPPIPADVNVQLVLGEPEHALTVEAGERFAVVTESNFAWREAERSGGLALVEETTGPTDTNQSERGWTGGATWRVFVYEARAGGEQGLTFEEIREWEPEHVMTTRRIDITVAPESASPSSAEGR
jgi:predicted secreted protein